MSYKSELQIGEVVILKVPSRARTYVYGRGWLPEGWDLIKNVGAYLVIKLPYQIID